MLWNTPGNTPSFSLRSVHTKVWRQHCWAVAIYFHPNHKVLWTDLLLASADWRIRACRLRSWSPHSPLDSQHLLRGSGIGRHLDPWPNSRHPGRSSEARVVRTSRHKFSISLTSLEKKRRWVDECVRMGCQRWVFTYWLSLFKRILRVLNSPQSLLCVFVVISKCLPGESIIIDEKLPQAPAQGQAQAQAQAHKHKHHHHHHSENYLNFATW